MELLEWYVMYSNTHNETVRIEWPDGGCYLDQAIMLVEMWSIITTEKLKYRKEIQERNNRR